MSDDSESMEDTKKGSLAEVTDDSCTLEYINNNNNNRALVVRQLQNVE